MRVYTRAMSNPCYCVALRKAGRRLTSLYNDALAPLGINVAQFSQLRHISRLEPVSLTELAQRLDLDRSTVGRNTKLLEKMGLVESGVGEDLRENVLALTAAGKTLLHAALPVWEEVQDRIENKLGGAGADKLLDILAVL